jgi:sugar phosphate isomerase/epimerase
MRIGLTYLYVIYRCGYPPAFCEEVRAFPAIRKLGFRFLEVEGLGPRHLNAVYRRRRELQHALEDNGLHVHNFCVVDPDLVSLSLPKRHAAIERFKLGAELAGTLGADTIHLASYAPPVRYLTSMPYRLGAKGGYRFPGATRIRIPHGFSWDAVWTALVESCRACADIAAANEKVVLMEPRVGETICTVDSLLRLLEHAGRPNLKANFDTGHFAAQRENPVLALEKLRGSFANIHISDNDPANADHLPVGDGTIDWLEFFRGLKSMGYTGYLGLDHGGGRSPATAYRRSLDCIREVAAKLRLDIEV